MKRSMLVKDDYFGRISARITRIALARLNWACEKRERIEAGRVPQGRILTEMIMRHLEPHPEELRAHQKKPFKTIRRNLKIASA